MSRRKSDLYIYEYELYMNVYIQYNIYNICVWAYVSVRAYTYVTHTQVHLHNVYKSKIIKVGNH